MPLLNNNACIKLLFSSPFHKSIFQFLWAALERFSKVESKLFIAKKKKKSYPEIYVSGSKGYRGKKERKKKERGYAVRLRKGPSATSLPCLPEKKKSHIDNVVESKPCFAQYKNKKTKTQKL